MQNRRATAQVFTYMVYEFNECLTPTSRQKCLKYLLWDSRVQFCWNYLFFWDYCISHSLNATIKSDNVFWDEDDEKNIEKLNKENDKYEEYSFLLDCILSNDKWFLYIFECNWIYKIGITWDIENRYKKYVTENPFTVKILSVIELYWYSEMEKYIHNKYKDKRHRWEWFNITLEEAKEIQEFVEWVCFDIVIMNWIYWWDGKPFNFIWLREEINELIDFSDLFPNEIKDEQN